MAVAFARTTRSLNKDDFRVPTLVWIMAAIVLAGWTWWFFTAQIPVSRSAPDGTGAAVEPISPARLALRAIERPLKPAAPKTANPR